MPPNKMHEGAKSRQELEGTDTPGDGFQGTILPTSNCWGLFEYLEDTAMSDLTLESLAKRVEALEKILATKEPDQSRTDWRKVVGIFRDSEFMRKVDEECMRAREAEREAARRVARMILLDTDHTTFLKYPTANAAAV